MTEDAMQNGITKTSSPGTVTQFFLIAFLFTWLLQIPGVLAQQGIVSINPGTYTPLAMLGIFGPLVAATYLSARQGGRSAVVALYRPLLKWRVAGNLYLLAFALPAVLLSLGLYLLSLGGYAGRLGYWVGGSTMLAAFIISIAEEVGWRGYALPHLQQKFDPITSSAIIALFWGLWHIPMFLGQGIPLNLFLVMSLYFLGASLLFTRVYNASGGSLLLAAFAHMGVHLNNSFTALPGDQIPFVAHAMIYAGIGVFLYRSALVPRRIRTPSTTS